MTAVPHHRFGGFAPPEGQRARLPRAACLDVSSLPVRPRPTAPPAIDQAPPAGGALFEGTSACSSTGSLSLQTTSTPATDGQTRALFDRLLTLVEEQKRVAADIKDLKTEIKSAGHDPAEMVLAVQMHLEPEKFEKKDAQKEGAERILAALGHLAGTPLGERSPADAAATERLRAGPRRHADG